MVAGERRTARGARPSGYFRAGGTFGTKGHPMKDAIAGTAHRPVWGSARAAASHATSEVPAELSQRRGRRAGCPAQADADRAWCVRLGRRVGAAPAVVPVVAMLGASPVYHPDASTAPGKAVVQDLL